MTLIGFFNTVGKLKHLRRQGWVERGVQQPESVAGHSFRLALLSMVFAERQNLDACKAVKMALIHDLPEALCGDTVTRISEGLQQVSNREKRRREEKSLKEILHNLEKGNGAIALEIFSLWKEFEEGKSREARLVRELDRLEAIFQAAEYERAGNFTVSLQEFYDYADARLHNRELRAVFQQLMQERQA